MTAEDIQRTLGDYKANRDIWLKERVEMASRISRLESRLERIIGAAAAIISILSAVIVALLVKEFGA